MNSYLEPQAEFFDRAVVPPQIQELLDEWPNSPLTKSGLVDSLWGRRG
jgi:hypothetical protein